jgi:hypothetical protein
MERLKGVADTFVFAVAKPDEELEPVVVAVRTADKVAPAWCPAAQ